MSPRRDFTALDHLVMTVTDLDRTIAFYRDVLGCEIVTFGGDRKAIRFGSQKINLHPIGQLYPPVAQYPTPGSLDLCFLTDTPIQAVLEELRLAKIDILEGPVKRTGATSALFSIYVRDPDGNLIEIANKIDPKL